MWHGKQVESYTALSDGKMDLLCPEDLYVVPWAWSEVSNILRLLSTPPKSRTLKLSSVLPIAASKKNSDTLNKNPCICL